MSFTKWGYERKFLQMEPIRLNLYLVREIKIGKKEIGYCFGDSP